MIPAFLSALVSRGAAALAARGAAARTASSAKLTDLATKGLTQSQSAPGAQLSSFASRERQQLAKNAVKMGLREQRPTIKGGMGGGRNPEREGGGEPAGDNSIDTFLGSLKKLTDPSAKLASSLTQINDQAEQFKDGLLASGEASARFSSETNAAVARLQAGDIRRGIVSGQSRSASTKSLFESENRLRDAWRPIEDAIANMSNSFATMVNNVKTAGINFAANVGKGASDAATALKNAVTGESAKKDDGRGTVEDPKAEDTPQQDLFRKLDLIGKRQSENWEDVRRMMEPRRQVVGPSGIPGRKYAGKRED